MKIYSTLSSLKSTKFQILVEIQQNDRKVFRKIEEIFLSDEHQGFILKIADNNDIQANLKEFRINPRFYRELRGINKIQILILDTWMKRAPAIKKLEFWGEFSSSNSKEEIEEISRLINESIKEIESQKSNSEFNQDSINEGFKIPEDFLDAITHELLTMPYILPSGAVVDETTLEKHKRNEESYGRLPSDPFTGVYYTSESQPKFDTSLKMRLDEFKLRHSHEIEVKNSGRTVGRKEPPCQPSTSTAVNHISKKIKLSKESSLDELIQSIYKNNQISNFTTPKSSQESSSEICCGCKNNSNLYKITTCDHLFCKDCLIKLNSTCGVCKISFKNENVMKFHL